MCVQRHKLGAGSPARGIRSHGHDSSQAARELATCTGARSQERCHGTAPSASQFRRAAEQGDLQPPCRIMAGVLLLCTDAVQQQSRAGANDLILVYHTGGP